MNELESNRFLKIEDSWPEGVKRPWQNRDIAGRLRVKRKQNSRDLSPQSCTQSCQGHVAYVASSQLPADPDAIHGEKKRDEWIRHMIKVTQSDAHCCWRNVLDCSDTLLLSPDSASTVFVDCLQINGRTCEGLWGIHSQSQSVSVAEYNEPQQ